MSGCTTSVRTGRKVYYECAYWKKKKKKKKKKKERKREEAKHARSMK